MHLIQFISLALSLSARSIDGSISPFSSLLHLPYALLLHLVIVKQFNWDHDGPAMGSDRRCEAGGLGGLLVASSPLCSICHARALWAAAAGCCSTRSSKYEVVLVALNRLSPSVYNPIRSFGVISVVCVYASLSVSLYGGSCFNSTSTETLANMKASPLVIVLKEKY
jgi:hypothetical protein